MIVEASLTGLLKTVLIVIGALVALRFIGRLMIAKRNLDEDRKVRENHAARQKVKEYVEKNEGRTRILSPRSRQNEPFEDVSYEEVKND